ncbi:MAG: hypothetical protein Q7T20_05135 [Saprospiraceae bacterium]|nr:hypothetical protein [Saprospiraceae bacterium]
MNLRFLISLIITLPGSLPAQTCGFSEGKNLATLRAAVFARGSRFDAPPIYFGIVLPTPPGRLTQIPPFVLLPKWSVEELPFFCKIEHNWGKKSRLPFKFRLGSVEYVDGLEGKL